jgi:FkbM family methyltransferase
MRSVEGRWGQTWFIDKDIYVGASLFHYGEYGPDETEMIIALAAEAGQDRLCLDIGANFGVMAQALETSGFRCEAFEPQPDVFSCLVRNVKGKCHQLAVGDAAGTAKMPKILNGAKANYGGMGLGFRSELGTIDVPVTTIDSLNYADVGFVKLDVEGYEEKALRGAAETITRCRPILYVEDDRANKSASLRDYIAFLGYTIKEHKPTLFRENNFFGSHKIPWGGNIMSTNLICRPTG